MAVTIGAVLVVVLVFVVSACSSEIIAPLCDFMLTFAMEPLTIPYVNQVILWGQACAIVVVIVVRIYKGTLGVGLGWGSARTEDLGEWTVKSVLAIAGVALMPVFCNMIVTLGSMMFEDVRGGVAPASISGSFVAIEESEFEAILTSELPDLFAIFATTVLVCVLLIACVKVTYELLKRQLVMLVICVVAPWVSIKASMDRADDYLDLLTSLLGVCIIQWAQYLFLMVALSMFSDFAAGATWLQADLLSDEGIRSAFLCFAAFGAALAVPTVIERYAFSSGRGGSGTMVVGMALRGGVRGLGGAARAVAGKMGG